jgi:hypothetical protein
MKTVHSYVICNLHEEHLPVTNIFGTVRCEFAIPHANIINLFYEKGKTQPILMFSHVSFIT